MMEAVWEFLRGYWEIGCQWALDYLSRYQYLTQGEYYENLFTQYFSVGGFVLGLIFVGIIFLAAHEDQKGSDFIKIVGSVAVINSCRAVMTPLYTAFGVGTVNSLALQAFCPAYNIISGFLATLVVSSYYREHGVRALILPTALRLSEQKDGLAGLWEAVPPLVLPSGKKAKQARTQGAAGTA